MEKKIFEEFDINQGFTWFCFVLEYKGDLNTFLDSAEKSSAVG